jgi:hypothetical protein
MNVNIKKHNRGNFALFNISDDDMKIGLNSSRSVVT